jgi:parallel beta-helix repeat protein
MATTPERLPSYIKPGVSKFTELSDVPSSYAGNAGKAVQVKSTEDGLEFQTIISGKRTATKIVAANDSLDKSRADYVCDGNADEVEINQAITDLGTTGGTVLLLEGNYALSSKVILKPGVKISGIGHGTKIGGTTDIIFQVNQNCDSIEISNLTLTRARPLLRVESGYTVQFSIFRNLFIDAASSEVFLFCGPVKWSVFKNIITSTAVNHIIRTYSNFEYNVVESCVNEGGGLFYSDADFCRFNVFANNILYGSTQSVYLFKTTGGSYSYENVIIGNWMPTTGDVFIDTSNCQRCRIIGNVLGGTFGNCANQAIKVGSSSIVANNIISNINKEGIYLLKASNCIIKGNVLENVGKGADNTYAAILLTDDGVTFSTRNVISGNRISSGAANKPAYGIRENAAGDDYNLVDSNIVTDCVTAQISLQGVNSVRADNIPATG